MTKASDNLYPSVLFVEGSAPSSPAATNFRLYYDSSDHLLKWKNSAGTVTTIATGSPLADPMTTRGDVIVRDASNVTARLAVGAAGTLLGRSGSDVLYVFPPGYELGYTEYTSDVTTTATSEGTATTAVTSASIACDGAAVGVEFYCGRANVASVAILDLYVDSTVQGRIATVLAAHDMPILVRRRLTPSNASHTFTVKVWESGGTVNLKAGAGGSGTDMPGYIRVTKV